jgi:hypothetical protein
MAEESGPGEVVPFTRPAPFVGNAGGSGPNDPDVEARLSRLETAVNNVQRDLQALRESVARIDGKISNLPTTFQLIYMQLGLILTIFALAFALLKLAQH